jgi:hypothetical protein
MKTLSLFAKTFSAGARALALPGMAAALLAAGQLQAAISLGPTGTTGTLTFETQPTVADGWSTISIAGGAGDTFDATSMDADVQTRAASAITTQVGSSTTQPISANALARWHGTLRLLMTPPTSVRYTVLMATLQNDTGADQSTLTISYNLGENSQAGTTITEEIPGHRVYWSLTGEPNSWTVISELSSVGTPGSVVGTMNLGAWAPGSPLYIIWADDNAAANRDNAGTEEGGYTIDNFVAKVGNVDPPVITQQPISVTTTQGLSFQLSVAATGLGLQYQWFQGGVPMDVLLNPTVRQPILVVTNAALSDDADYLVTVSNGGGTETSTSVHVTVHPDQAPPVFVRATESATDLSIMTVQVNEPLCQDAGACGSDAGDAGYWDIVSLDGSEQLGVAAVTVNGTNLTFQTGIFRDPSKSYKVVASAFGPGISDRFGNFMPVGSFIEVAHTVSFRQNVNGYAGTHDTELRGAAADTAQGLAVGITVDTADGGGISYGLLRFDNIFGSNPGQVPIGAEIVGATLTIEHTVANANGNPVELHRMYLPWDAATATYNSMVNGIQADGTEASMEVDSIIDSTGRTVPFTITADVTPSLIDWANSQPNYGWAFIPTGTDGYRFDTSESTTPPTLAVSYRLVPCSEVIITMQPAASTVVNEGESFTLAVTATSPGCPASYQWFKNGDQIAGATSPIYRVQNAGPSDAGTYTVAVFNDAPSGVQSSPAVVVVNADAGHPVLTRTLTPDASTVVLTFSKRLSAATAQNVANYSFNPVLAVSSAVLSNGPTTATVTLTTAARSFPTRYTLVISGLTDNSAMQNLLSPNPTEVALTSVSKFRPWAGTWKYETNSQDATLVQPATPWYASGFNDSTWLTGSGLFGVEPSAGTIPLLPMPITTPLPLGTNQPTYYFRTTITVPALPADAQYMLCHFVDDGAIFYVDGVEVSRYFMTNVPPVLFGDFASGTPNGGDGSTVCVPVNLTAGTHTLAVELHQANATSSDVVFGAELQVVSLPPTVSIAAGPEAGQAKVSWKADSSWELVTSDNVLGPFAPVAGNPLGSFTVPNVGSTNQAFFHLRYRDNR